MMGGIDIIVLIATLMAASTPVLLAATGELVAEKSGVLNLGVEGMMIMGAVGGFAVATATGSPVLGFAAGAVAGALLALLFAVLTQIFLSNQVATGLALTLFGLGLSALIGKGYEGVRPPPTAKLEFGPLADIPVLGPILFSHDWVVYASLVLVALTWAVLKYTRAGLILRAVGESHDAAHALGYRVVAVRFAALAYGGALAGMGGAYLSLVRVPQWTEGMTAGAGWIALAIVVFASWRAERVLIGAYLFGGITALQLQLQAAGYAIPVHLLSMAPYVITIIVLVILSAAHRHGVAAAPAALGRSFHASN
ncbi:ABC transporter permease [Paenirhodobacter sp. CAU 1674]|uniref:ABC transporter permease n=1 Tax=Paenirhodobacter sp. CAU 1674 TaxID=3032596 RepID=UPI0023DB70BF|nr:ABC transporter permease [Paenirhodobacter sp. CAU 1674]MDF2141313.1 ABC transporter permease [Paenirhodobacter sp. CAU 1674]